MPQMATAPLCEAKLFCDHLKPQCSISVLNNSFKSPFSEIQRIHRGSLLSSQPLRQDAAIYTPMSSSGTARCSGYAFASAIHITSLPKLLNVDELHAYVILILKAEQI